MSQSFRTCCETIDLSTIENVNKALSIDFLDFLSEEQLEELDVPIVKKLNDDPNDTHIVFSQEEWADHIFICKYLLHLQTLFNLTGWKAVIISEYSYENELNTNKAVLIICDFDKRECRTLDIFEIANVINNGDMSKYAVQDFETIYKEEDSTVKHEIVDPHKLDLGFYPRSSTRLGDSHEI